MLFWSFFRTILNFKWKLVFQLACFICFILLAIVTQKKKKYIFASLSEIFIETEKSFQRWKKNFQYYFWHKIKENSYSSFDVIDILMLEIIVSKDRNH